MTADTAFFAACAAALLAMFIYYKKSRRRAVRLLTGTLTGLAALFIVQRYDFLIGADIPLNAFNLCGSAVLGVPFVLCMVILRFI